MPHTGPRANLPILLFTFTFASGHPSLSGSPDEGVLPWLALPVIQTRAQAFRPLPNTLVCVPLLVQEALESSAPGEQGTLGFLTVSFCFFSWER